MFLFVPHHIDIDTICFDHASKQIHMPFSSSYLQYDLSPSTHIIIKVTCYNVAEGCEDKAIVVHISAINMELISVKFV